MSTTRPAVRRRFGALIAVATIGSVLALAGCDNREPMARLIAEAKTLRDAGNIPAAALKLKIALAQDPKNHTARLLSAQLYIDLTEGDAALGILKRAELDGASESDIAELRAEADLLAHRYREAIKDTAVPPPDLPIAAKASLLASRALALGAFGQKAAARVALDEGLALDPDSVDVRISSARLAIADDDPDTARRQLADAVRVSPKDRRLTQLEGDIAYAARDYPGADQIYRKILGAEPWNELARGDLAATQLAEDKVTEAIATLDTILNDPDLADVPKDPILFHIRAVAAYRQKDYALAQSLSETVVTRVPGFEPARLIAGASSFALHEYEQANYYLGPYVYVNPKDVLAVKLLAAIQLQLGHPGEAAKTLAPVDGNAGTDPALLTLIGVAAARSGNMVVADRYLKQAVEQQPDNALLRTELGRTEIALGNSKAGIEDLEQAVKAQPEALGPQIPLFLAYMRTKEYDKALAVAEQVIKSQPNAVTGYLFASSVDLIQGKVEAGRAALLKAREIHPGDVNADRNLAKLALADGKVDEARQYYQEIIDHNPQSTQTYIALADLEVRGGHLPEAQAILVKATQASPDDVTAIAVLARFQLAQGKAQEALAAAQGALKKAPRNPALLDILGHAQLALGQRDGALSTFRDLTDIAPQAAWSHTGLAEAYLAQFTPDNPQWTAITEATAAVKLDPQDETAKVVLARALIMHGRFADAHEVVDGLDKDHPQDIQVIELDGLEARGEGHLAPAAAAFARAVALNDNAVDRRRLADTQMHLGRADDAVKTLENWLGAHTDDTETRKILADLYMRTGRLDEAGKQYAELVKREPKNPVALNDLAWIMLRLGRSEDALADAREAVALAPDSADNLDTLGAILLQNGSPTEAVDPLDKAWQKSSHRADIGFHLSQALAATGKKHEALDLLRGVLAGGGTFEDRAQAQQLLQQLGG